MANKTGTYKYVPGEGMVKVSDKVPTLQPFVYFPGNGEMGGYFDEHLCNGVVRDKNHKRQLMKEKHRAEAGPYKRGCLGEI